MRDRYISELIDFVDRRKTSETDGISRQITMEMAWDSFLASETEDTKRHAFAELQKCGRDDIFQRFSHLTNIEKYDLDTIALQEIEAASPGIRPF